MVLLAISITRSDEQPGEVGRTAHAVGKEIENLFIRGLAAAGAKDRGPLKTHTDEWERIGAHHAASRLRAALDEESRQEKRRVWRPLASGEETKTAE